MHLSPLHQARISALTLAGPPVFGAIFAGALVEISRAGFAAWHLVLYLVLSATVLVAVLVQSMGSSSDGNAASSELVRASPWTMLVGMLFGLAVTLQ
jgi:hypothetical protein